MKSKIKELYNDNRVIKLGLHVPYFIYCSYIRFILKNTGSDYDYIMKHYKVCFGEYPNLENPETFNEKIQWRKLYEKNPKYTYFSDKYSARRCVENTIGRKYLPDLYSAIESADDISLESLPKRFAIKCNHDCGSTILVKNNIKFDFKAMRKFFKHRLKKNYYHVAKEWQYLHIKPLIIVEELLIDNRENLPNDIKFHCFNGEVQFIQVAGPSHSENNIYSRKWELLPFTYLNRNFKTEIKKPQNLKLMIQIAERLSSAFNYVRVDLYNVDGKIYFGEFTFTPNGGFGRFSPPKYDKLYGDLFVLDRSFLLSEQKA